MEANPYAAITDTNYAAANPYALIKDEDFAMPKSIGDEALNLGKTAVSLSTPLVTFPTELISGVVAGFKEKYKEGMLPKGTESGAGAAFARGREESAQKSADMLKMYEPDPGSLAAKYIQNPVSALFGEVAKEGQRFGKHLVSTWGIQPEDLMWELGGAVGELKAFGVLGEAGKGVKSAKEAVVQAARRAKAGLEARRIESSLEYTPSVEPPLPPATGGVSALPIKVPATRPTPREEIDRLKTEDLRRGAVKDNPYTDITDEKFTATDKAVENPYASITDESVKAAPSVNLPEPVIEPAPEPAIEPQPVTMRSIDDLRRDFVDSMDVQPEPAKIETVSDTQPSRQPGAEGVTAAPIEAAPSGPPASKFYRDYTPEDFINTFSREELRNTVDNFLSMDDNLFQKMWDGEVPGHRKLFAFNQKYREALELAAIDKDHSAVKSIIERVKRQVTPEEVEALQKTKREIAASEAEAALRPQEIPADIGVRPEEDWGVFHALDSRVVKNPYPEDLAYMGENFRKNNPSAPDEIAIRHAYDAQGNKYSWEGHNTLDQLRPLIESRFAANLTDKTPESLRYPEREVAKAPSPAESFPNKIEPEQAATPIRKAKPLRMDGTTRPEKAVPIPPAGFDSLPQLTRDKFNAAFESKDAATMQGYLYAANKNLRTEFESRTGVKLPKAVKDMRKTVSDYFNDADRAAVQNDISARLKDQNTRDAEFASQGLRQQLFAAPDAEKAAIVSRMTKEQAADALKQLDAAPGDDIGARKAIGDTFPELAAAARPTPKQAATPVIEQIAPAEVKVIPTTKSAEANVVSPKEQRAYVQTKVDGLIKDARQRWRDQNGGGGEFTDKEIDATMSKGFYRAEIPPDGAQKVTIDVPNDGQYRVNNDLKSLLTFQKNLSKMTEPTRDASKPPGLPSTKPTGKTPAQFEAEYEAEKAAYNEKREGVKQEYLDYPNRIERAKQEEAKWQQIYADVRDKKITLKSLAPEFRGKTPSGYDVNTRVLEKQISVKNIEQQVKDLEIEIAKNWKGLDKELKAAPRTIVDIAKDISTALGEKGTVGKQELTEKQVAARARLTEDMRQIKMAADNAKVSIEEHLKKIYPDLTDAELSHLMQFAPKAPPKADAPTNRQEIVEPGASQGKGPEIPRSQEIAAELPKEDVISLKKRIVDPQDQSMGLSEVEREILRAVPTYEEGRRLLASGRRNPRTITADVVENHRMMTLEEAGVVLADRVTLDNQRMLLEADIAKAITDGDTATIGEKKIALEMTKRDLQVSSQSLQSNRELWSAIGKVMQLEAKRDYSLESMIRKAKIDTGKEVTPEHRAILEKHAKEIERLQSEIAMRDEKISQAEMIKTVEKLKNTVSKEQRDVKRSIKKEVLDAEIKGLYAEFNSKFGATRLNANIPLDAIPVLGKLAKAYVERGVITAEGIVDAIYTEVKNLGLEVSKRDIRDAISGYGTTRTMNQDVIIAQLRELKRQMALISGLEDAQGGKSPTKRFQSDVETPRVRELKKQIKQAMKENGLDTSKIPTTEQQWKTSLEATKTRLRNQIEDLTSAILGRKELAKKKGISAVDEETAILKSYSESLKKVYDQVFEDPNLEAQKKALAAQRAISIELIRLDKQISDYIKRTEEKDVASRARKLSPPKTEDIRLMREVRDTAKQTFEDMKKELRPKKSPDEIALQSYKTRTKNKIAELEAKRESGDFTKKERKQLELDKEGTNLKFKLSQEQKSYYEAAENYRLANRGRVERIWDGIKEVGNLSRAIKTSMDLSAVLRQGGFIALGHPVRALMAFPDMFKALKSEEGRFAVDQEILARPNYQLYEQSKLYLSEHGQVLSRMEEAYMSRLVDKLAKGSAWNPGRLVFKGAAASERAYTTFLNRLRADSFDAMYKNLAIDGTPTELAAISNYVNVATGRGNIGTNRQGIINSLTTMNSVFFAPRYVLSRFQLLVGQPALRGTARTRIMVAKEYGRFLGGLAVFYVLGTAAGGDIETDPRSTDFGKIRFGNTRLDPMSGLSQTAVVTSKIGASIINRIAPDTFEGNVNTEGDISDRDISYVGGRFVRSKLNPIVGISYDLMTGRAYLNKEVGRGVPMEENLSYAAGQLVPLALSDIFAVMEEQGVPAGTAFAMLSIFGMGLQTYNNE